MVHAVHDVPKIMKISWHMLKLWQMTK